ncbi:MAG: phage head closure protein [Halanaerobiales bacterium]
MAKRHKIIFVESGEEVSDGGELIEVLKPIYENDTEKSSSWASFKDLKGTAFYASQQTNNKIEGTVKIRYRSDIKPEYQFKLGDRVFEIVGPPVNIDEKNRDLLIRYREVI